jgi:hypothetical protein
LDLTNPAEKHISLNSIGGLAVSASPKGIDVLYMRRITFEIWQASWVSGFISEILGGRDVG